MDHQDSKWVRKRKWVGTLVVLTLLAAWMRLTGLDAIAKWVADFHSTVYTLRMMQLPLTRENMDLYLSSLHPPPALPPFPPLVAPERTPRFTDDMTYAAMRNNGIISIGVYIQPPEEWGRQLPALQGAIRRAQDSGIQLVHLPDADAFRQALDRDPVVIFIGHANLGLGPVLRSAQGHDVRLPIPGAEPAPTAEVDAVQQNATQQAYDQEGEKGGALDLGKCRLFMYLGCRTEIYYGDALSASNPHTELVLGWYMWSATGFMTEGLQILVDGMIGQHPLSAIMKRWENRLRRQMLHARLQERDAYGNPGPYPRTMLVHRPLGL